MATYAINFIGLNGGVRPQLIGSKLDIRSHIAYWSNSVLTTENCDRVCILEIPSPSERRKTGYEGRAFVFNQVEARRWAGLEIPESVK
jgi:hypothetical protein